MPPGTVPQAFEVALQHHQAGRLGEAEAIYRQILAVQPQHADALHLLGVFAHQVGRHDLAVDLIRQAIALAPNAPACHSNLGEAYRMLGQSDAAIASYRRALQLKPDYAEAHNNLGSALRERGRIEEAISACRRATELRPDFADAYTNLGSALRDGGRLGEAIAAQRRALQLQPGSVEAHTNLGNALLDKGECAEAVAAYHQALRIKPDYVMALSNLGNALKSSAMASAHSPLSNRAFPRLVCASTEPGCKWSARRQALRLKPDYVVALGNLGNALKSSGRLEEAILAYRRALEVAPTDAGGHSNLGNALSDAGRIEEAIEAFHRAIELRPDLAEAHNNLGNALWEQGRLEEAIAAHQRAIELRPDYAEAHSNLGVDLSEKGELDQALAACRRALELKPKLAQIHFNLGLVLGKKGLSDHAVAAYGRALELKPDYPEAHNNLGTVRRDQGMLDEAIAACGRAIQLRSDYAEAWNNLGCAQADRGRFDEAIAAYRRALQIKPAYAEAHNNLGTALRDQGRGDEAVAACRRALELKPDFAEAHNNLGVTLSERGALDAAVEAFHRAIHFKPDSAEAYSNLGNARKDQGCMDEATESYRRAVLLKPDDASLHSNLVYTALFHPRYDQAAVREECTQWSRQHGAPLARTIRPHPNAPEPGRRLKVGYVSPNFSRHVISHFLTPLLEAHDHAGFEIYCYASVKRPDATTQRLKKSADVWRDMLGVRDETLAERIREDEIDILVDLTQHMAENRLLVFARKPAPVQVAWVGYPGSTGLKAMDYRFTDAQMEPEGSPWSESVEAPVRLPDSWFCFDPIDEYPEPGELPALRAGHVTFGCLNTFCKVNDAVLHRWAGVLRAVEGSRLLLRCPKGGAQTRVHHFLDAEGIAPERVELSAWTATRAEFLNLFQRMDIALDPFPYNGGTTTCEALSLGVPVLTLPGELIVSRIGLSILMACGMPEFVAHSEEEYVRLAVSLASDLPRLAQMRATLRARMKASPFMDGPRFARNVEAAYRQMWRAWCANQSTVPVP